MLIKSSGSSWNSSYGAWQSFSTFTPGTVIGPSGISAKTSIGSKTLFIRANGWYAQIAQDMTSIVGFFSAYSNGGECGGAGVVGYNPMCLTYSNDSGSHFDAASLKEAYIKALN